MIEITKLNKNSKKEYYNECLTIFTYIRKIINKPKLKIKGITNLFFEASIIMLALYFLCMIIAITIKPNKILITAFITGFIFFSYLCYVILYKHKINLSELLKESDKIKKSSLTVDKNGIKKTTINNKNKNTLLIKWKDLKYVLINEKTIFFIPKDISLMNPMSVPSNQKDKIIELLKDNNKESFIIDNTDMYNKKSFIKKIFQIKKDLEILFW